jgi:DNA (cytosine-5)-methyltransferase 1
MSQRRRRTGQVSTRPLPPVRETPYTVVDLFSGAGGMSCGFWQAGFNIRGAIDKQVGKPDEVTPCNDTYRMNFGVTPEDHDLMDEAGEGNPVAYRNSKRMEPGELTVLISCPPCTGYSQKNYKNHLHDDPRNALVYKTKGFVEAFLPEFLVMENVPEMFRGNNRHHFRALYDDLVAMGYSVFVHVFDFADFGLPQHRKRAIVLARQNHGPVPNLDALRHGQHVTIRQALAEAHLPRLANGEQDQNDPVHVCAHVGRRAERVLQRCMLIRDRGRGRWTGLQNQDLTPAEWDLLTGRIQKALEQGDVNTYPDCYGTALPDLPSKTLVRQCGDIGTGAWFHWEEPRMLSAREMAILQGFPYEPEANGEQPFYRFAGPPAKIYQQIGNAVPPLISRMIAEEILRLLHSETPGLAPDQFPDPHPFLDDEPEQATLAFEEA